MYIKRTKVLYFLPKAVQGFKKNTFRDHRGPCKQKALLVANGNPTVISRIWVPKQ